MLCSMFLPFHSSTESRILSSIFLLYKGLCTLKSPSSIRSVGSWSRNLSYLPSTLGLLGEIYWASCSLSFPSQVNLQCYHLEICSNFYSISQSSRAGHEGFEYHFRKYNLELPSLCSLAWQLNSLSQP